MNYINCFLNKIKYSFITTNDTEDKRTYYKDYIIQNLSSICICNNEKTDFSIEEKSIELIQKECYKIGFFGRKSVPTTNEIARIVFRYKNDETKLNETYSYFKSNAGNPKAKGCKDFESFIKSITGRIRPGLGSREKHLSKLLDDKIKETFVNYIRQNKEMVTDNDFICPVKLIRNTFKMIFNDNLKDKDKLRILANDVIKKQ